MRWTGGFAVMAALAAGVAVGFVAADVTATSPGTDGAARPATASSPSVPVDPPPELKPDPSFPALRTDLATHRETLGAAGFEVSLPIPDGWQRTDSGPNEAKWRNPDYIDNAYVLRVEQTATENTGFAETIDERIADLEAAEEDLQVLDRTNDSLEFTFVVDGYLRHGFLTWLDLTGSGEAELEIALTGRERDVPGMVDLLETVVAGARTA